MEVKKEDDGSNIDVCSNDEKPGTSMFYLSVLLIIVITRLCNVCQRHWVLLLSFQGGTGEGWMGGKEV